MNERINEVTIVGGGSAGWIMGLVLTTLLNRADKDHIKVTLIESPRIPNIGVGEGTVTGFSRLLRQLQIPEKDFILNSDATFKCAGRFIGWNLDSKGDPITFYNPFIESGYLEGLEAYRYFHKYGAGGENLIQATQPTIDLVENCLSPKIASSRPYEGLIPYTYHLNAAAFSEQLAAIAKQRGVRYIQDEMQDVELDERGFVSALQLEENGRFPIQFVVDCTGFRGSILQQKLGEPFLDYGKHLLVDRAIPMPIAHADPDRIPPCTTATALSGGWMFGVPLQSRMGTGYIFSSAFKSDEQAWDELKATLGDRVPADAEPRVIRMNIGRVRNTWVKNCIATGLSAGFVEPLEATAIYTIEQTARLLAHYFPEFGVNDRVVSRVNEVLDLQYREILDFIVMMYYTSNRPEPFWRAAREDIVVPDTLLENLELWKQYLPNLNDISGRFLFSAWNYYFILAGKGYFDKDHYPGESMLRKEPWEKMLNQVANSKPKVMKQLLPQRDYLNSLQQPEVQNSVTYSINYQLS